MGGVPSILLCLWCRGGCSTSTVAAALTFFPPVPPCYKLKESEGDDELELELDDLLESTASTTGVQIALVSTCGYTVGTRRQRARTSPGKPLSGNSKGKGRGKGKGSTIPVILHRREGARFTLIYSHGNATDIGAMHDRCAGIADAVGINVLAYDYSGYGAASGSPTEANTYRDIAAACDWARENVLREGEDGSGRNKEHGLILYGQSVGSGPTCYLAAEGRGEFAGVILHSPIMSGMRVLTESRALSCLDIYPNLDRVARVRCPVMVMHGMKDEEVPWEHGKGIYEAVPDSLRRPPWWVRDRGHNDMCDGRRHLREYFARLNAFVRCLEDEDNGADYRVSTTKSAASARDASRKRSASGGGTAVVTANTEDELWDDSEVGSSVVFSETVTDTGIVAPASPCMDVRVSGEDRRKSGSATAERPARRRPTRDDEPGDARQAPVSVEQGETQENPVAATVEVAV